MTDTDFKKLKKYLKEIENSKPSFRRIRSEAIDYLENHLGVKHHVLKETNYIMYYNGKHYEADEDRNWILSEINKFLKENQYYDFVSAKQITEIINKYIQGFAGKKKSIDDFELAIYESQVMPGKDGLEKYPTVLINTLGGVILCNINTKSSSLVKHSDNYKFTKILYTVYDPKTPGLGGIVDEMLEILAPNPSDRLHLIDGITNTFIPNFKIEKATVLYGHGGNGKSSLVGCIAKLRSDVQPKDLGELGKDFGTAILFGSDLIWAKIEGIEDTKNVPMGKIEAITSGEKVEINIKNIPNFSTVLKAKMIITANYMIILRDTSDFRRFIIIKTPERKGEIDVTIKQRMLEQESVDRFFEIILNNIPRLYTHTNEIIEESDRRTREVFNVIFNPFQTFCNDNLSYNDDSNSFTSTNTITDKWNEYAKKHGHTAKNNIQVGKLIGKEFGLKAQRIGNERGFKGLYFSNDFTDEELELIKDNVKRRMQERI